MNVSIEKVFELSCYATGNFLQILILQMLIFNQPTDPIKEVAVKHCTIRHGLMKRRSIGTYICAHTDKLTN